MKCPHCHFVNPADTRFCGNCAALLRPDPSATPPSPPARPSQQPPPQASTRTVSAPPLELASGAVLAGRYQVIEELGAGGMGRVYKVQDTKVGERIALKLLRPETVGDGRALERFSNELKLTRKIRHKTICQVFDLGEDRGTSFITMEYVRGEDLRQLIRKVGRLSPGQAVPIVRQVCAGLEEAHKLGVVHRDLKPQNIMLDEDGNARIMDFGIARSLAGKGITGAGTFVGTPEYTSPEQVEGKDVDERSDIYSLGVILYEMVTGQRPFDGETPLSIAHKHKYEAPGDPRALAADVPDGLARVILKCLEKDKGARFASARDLDSALAAVEEGLPTVEKVLPKRKSRTAKGITVTFNLRKLALPVLAAAAVVAIAAFLFLKPEKQAPAAGMKRIAVLPFENLGGPDDEYFAEGIAEELINALARIQDLRVVARTSALALKGMNLDVRDIGRRLNVKAVLEGSIRKAGGRLRVTAQLVDVDDGFHLWSGRYDRDVADIFDIQDEITAAIVDSLKVTLNVGEKTALRKRSTDDPEAYNLYLMGRYFWNKRTPDGMKRGLEYFGRAIAKDPRFARAYTGVADCYSLFAYYYLPPRPTLMKAKEAAEKAIELDGMLAEAHTSLAFVKQKLEREWKGAEREFRRAIELDPEYMWAHHWYALFLAVMGRHEEAVAGIQRALDIDPTSAQVTMVHGMIMYLGRHYDRAIEELTRAVEMDPQHVLANFYLGLAWLEKGEYDKAALQVRKSVEMTGGVPFFLQGIGFIHATAGRAQEARGVLAEIGGMAAQAYVSPVFTALIHFRLGEADRGFAWLDRAFEDGDHWLEFIKVFPGFDGVRTDPRYFALLERLKIE